jgi:hypothetical protein
MLERRIAPSTIVVRQRRVRWAKICSSDSDGTGETPFGVIITSHFITSTTAQAIVEQGSA